MSISDHPGPGRHLLVIPSLTTSAPVTTWHPNWDDIDNVEWLILFHHCADVSYTKQVGKEGYSCSRRCSRGDGDISVSSSGSALLEDQDGSVGSIEQFVSLRQLFGRPIAVVDP